MPPTVNLNEAVTYLTELLGMTKEELAREIEIDGRKLTKPNQVLFAFERKFDPNTRMPYGAVPIPRQGVNRFGKAIE